MTIKVAIIGGPNNGLNAIRLLLASKGYPDVEVINAAMSEMPKIEREELSHLDADQYEMMMNANDLASLLSIPKEIVRVDDPIEVHKAPHFDGRQFKEERIRENIKIKGYTNYRKKYR